MSADTKIDNNLALSAAVQLGQFVEKYWKFYSREQAERLVDPGEYIILSEQDKNHVRTNIVNKMYQCECQRIMKQYVRSMIKICQYDYPAKWPTLTNDISNALQSGNDKGILTGC